MSGTGNTLRVAKWINEKFIKNGVLSSINSIGQSASVENKTNKTNIICIAMPSHGFTAPWLMLKYVFKLQKGDGAHAICIATRAGLKIGRLFTPGLSGTATYVIALILFLKGYNVRGILCLDMPSNWIAFHWGLHPENSAAIIKKAKPKLIKFMDRIISDHASWVSLNNFYEFIAGICLLPISLGYLLIGRLYFAKLFFADNRCNGCGQCVSNCLANAITLKGKEKKVKPFWKYNCENCMRCMAFCPKGAIQASHSWAVILYFITTVPYTLYIVNWLSLENNIGGQFTYYLIWLFYTYLSIIFSYWIFTLLMKVSCINKLFTYTTLTKIYRRYHEPDTNLKDLKDIE